MPQAVPRLTTSRRSTPARRNISGDDPDTVDLNELVACPNCGNRHTWTAPRQFNMMLKTILGVIEDEAGLHYLRPETAQGIFINFANVVTSSRKKPPFGIAQMGKSFRNEITPGNFIFRTREFEQMEMEYFVKPGEDEEAHQYWIDERTRWFTDLGITSERLRHFEHPQEKLSHYAKRTVDIEYNFGFSERGFEDREGIANRTDFDLTQHSQASGQDLSYFDQASGERYVPYVIEPALGPNRAMMAFMMDAYTEDEAPNTKGGVDKRVVLKLDPRLAPVKVAVLPLSPTPTSARRPRTSPPRCAVSGWNVEFDDSGAIGRRYRRQDEIGTPYCVTVDFDTRRPAGHHPRSRHDEAGTHLPRPGPSRTSLSDSSAADPHCSHPFVGLGALLAAAALLLGACTGSGDGSSGPLRVGGRWRVG